MVYLEIFRIAHAALVTFKHIHHRFDTPSRLTNFPKTTQTRLTETLQALNRVFPQLRKNILKAHRTLKK